MSFQRAYVNCIRCYRISVNQKQYNKLNPSLEVRQLLDDSICTARNEAMEALEHYNRGLWFSNRAIEDCLDACVACDFSTSAIQKYINENVWKKDKKK